MSDIAKSFEASLAAYQRLPEAKKREFDKTMGAAPEEDDMSDAERELMGRRKLGAENARLRAQLDLRDRQYAELQSDFTALQKALVGETGASAILTAYALRRQRDMARETLHATADALMRVTDCFDDAIAASDWRHETKMSATGVVYNSRSIETRARRTLAALDGEDQT